MSAPPIKAHTTCRACGSPTLEPYLDLGEQAPANALRRPDDTSPEFTAPLSVSWCATCGLSQLDHIVDPAILYANYPFRAGISEKWRQHCAHLMTSLDKPGRRFLVDIGSNDGTLLDAAAERDWTVLGVDPAPVNPRWPVIDQLWSSGVARRVARDYGQAEVITATNVFGHVDDAKDFLEGLMLLLKPQGLAIIECPHIFPFLENVAFDTIYHEHLSYWSLRPLERLAESVGLKVIDVTMFSELHGGTMRYVLTPGDHKTKVKTTVTGVRILELANFNEGLTSYQTFAEQSRLRIGGFRALMLNQHMAGKRIWGYGASAKGHVLLQAAGVTAETMERVVDDCDAKWGFSTPGTHVPITSAADLSEPDVLVLLSWNNAPALEARARERGFQGAFFIPHSPA